MEEGALLLEHAHQRISRFARLPAEGRELQRYARAHLRVEPQLLERRGLQGDFARPRGQAALRAGGLEQRLGGFVHLPDDNATRHSGAGERANCVYAAHLLREAVFPQEGGVYGLRAAQLSKPVWFNDSPTVQVIVFRSLRKRFFSAR